MRTEVVPRQLPPAPAHFTGRSAEMAALTTALLAEPTRDEPTLAVVTGPGGVGKTALALRWLHSEQSRFTGGQLYADLAAHGPQGPASPGELLGGLLLGLGVPAGELPAQVADRAALYRSLTADKVIAVLLDDAASSSQVKALLPASRHSAVVVTSRRRLAGLIASGGRMVPVDALPPDAAVELLSRAVGRERVDGEPVPAREVALLCGGMPIALHITAARLVVRPHRRLATVATELTDERRRLRALVAEDGELSVAATFDLSYRWLPPAAARLYRRLGLHPGVDFDRAAAAALLGESEADAEDLLGVLVEANLVADTASDRYRFHDLLRLHARRQAEREDDEEDRRAALRSVVVWFLDRAVAADRVVTPLRPHLGKRYHVPASESFPTRASALDWLERELPNLMACQRTAVAHRWHDLVWQFYEAMWGLFLHRGHYEQWTSAGAPAVEAAVRCGDAVAEVRMLIQSAALHTRLGHPSAAVAPYRRALRRAREIGDWQGEATALEGIGAAEHALGRLDEAMTCYRRSLALNESHGRHRGVALLLCYLGHALVDVGDHAAAADHFRRAADHATTVGDRHCWAQAVVGLGTALAASGSVADAIARMEHGLAELPAAETAALRVPVLEKLAELKQRTGDRSAARQHWQEALDICTTLADPRADAIRSRLGPAD
ncbi:tetratricopeptide repeat protein [Saccharothrix variisporea]|uniref:tetratricopeptide repeat protein n=1 Tax=Saccharothrix variisporea TaxID=543527 RepID=UPI0011C40DD6